MFPERALVPLAVLAGVGLLWAGFRRTQSPQDARSGEGLDEETGDSSDVAAIYNPSILTPEQREIADLIIATAERAGIDPRFMLALAVTESSLRPAVIGDDGLSIGLFQLQLATARDWRATVTRDDLLDAALNADLAMSEMLRLHRIWPGRRFADYAEAWTLGGSGRFNKHRRNPGKVTQLYRAVNDLSLDLDPAAVWE